MVRVHECTYTSYINTFIQRELNCPNCQWRINVIPSRPITMCYKCDAILPDILQLCTDPAYRLNFHRVVG